MDPATKAIWEVCERMEESQSKTLLLQAIQYQLGERPENELVPPEEHIPRHISAEEEEDYPCQVTYIKEEWFDSDGKPITEEEFEGVQ